MLHALNAYFERHADSLPALGFEARPIHWAIVLDHSGAVVSLDDVRVDGDPISLVVPCWPGRTSGIDPSVLSDPAGYVLGAGDTRGKLAAWVDHNKAVLAGCGGPTATAVRSWLETWTPEAAAALTSGVELVARRGESPNVTLMVGERFAVQDPEIIAAWSAAYQARPGTHDVCSVTGRHEAIETNHRAVIGMAKLVSIDGDSDALHHYGLTDALASPVSRSAAHGYATALSSLSAQRQRITIGDVWVYYWSEADAAADASMADAMQAIFAGAVKPSDKDETARLADLVGSLARGQMPSGTVPETPYNLLAITPGTGRHVIRWHLRSTVGDLARHVAAHVGALCLDRAPSAKALIWSAGRPVDDCPPWLAIETMQAIVSGRPYPIALTHRVLARLRAGDELTPYRAAILRAWLVRNQNQGVDQMKDSVGYRIGAALHWAERMQLAAMPGVAITVRERLWSLLASRPQAGVARMLEGVRHHKAAVRRAEGGGLAEWFDNKIAEALAGVDLPAQLSQAEQAQMALGYYDARATKPKRGDDDSSQGK